VRDRRDKRGTEGFVPLLLQAASVWVIYFLCGVTAKILDERQPAIGEDQLVRGVGKTMNRLVPESPSGVVRVILLLYYHWEQKVRHFYLLLIVYISDPFSRLAPNDIATNRLSLPRH